MVQAAAIISPVGNSCICTLVFMTDLAETIPKDESFFATSLALEFSGSLTGFLFSLHGFKIRSSDFKLTIKTVYGLPCFIHDETFGTKNNEIMKFAISLEMQ